MTITVINTGVKEDWILVSQHLEHGKWMDSSPPDKIPENGIKNIRSEKQTGAAYGTTGSIQFKSSIKADSTLTIVWNKPYGHDATTCTVDMNSTDYTAKVEDKNFQTSEAFCNVVIKKNSTPVIDTKTWMSKLPGNTTLNNIMMPGSHDAGMSELHHCSIGAKDTNTQTQQLDIKGQLEAGSRYFDIRVDYDYGELVTYHRTGPFGCNGQTLEEVLDQMTSFVKKYKTEVPVLKFSHIRGNNKDTKTKIKNMLLSASFRNYLYKDDNTNLANINLSSAAGKLVIVLDYGDDIEPADGLFRYHDGFVSEVCSYRDLNITVCDLYSNTSKYSEMANDQISKWDKFAGLGNDYLFLLSWTLTADVTGSSIRNLAKEANDNLPSVLTRQINDYKKAKPNIVYIDFINVEIAREIISYNF